MESLFTVCTTNFHLCIISCRLTKSDAGLTTEERSIIAESYDNGVLKVIVATCSLAAGINLPARRVILQGARMGRDFVAPAMLLVAELFFMCRMALTVLVDR